MEIQLIVELIVETGRKNEKPDKRILFQEISLSRTGQAYYL